MYSILVPTDFSTESELALLIALGIARDRAAELILLHVVRPEDCSKEYMDEGELDRNSLVYQNSWSRFLRCKTLTNGVPTSFRVKVGNPVDVIPDVAQQECCDMIVIASHPRTFIERQLYGSITETLARMSMSPVVCIHPSPFQQKRISILDGLRREVPTESALVSD